MNTPTGGRQKRGGIVRPAVSETGRAAQTRQPHRSKSNVSFSGFVHNLKTDGVAHFIAGFNEPVRAMGSIVAFLGSVISLVGFFSAGGGATSGFRAPMILSVFPARVIAFALIAACIAWSLSSLNIWLTSQRDPLGRIAAHFITIIGAVFLAACIDWIFAPDIKNAPASVLFFVIVGVAFSVFLAKTNYKQTLEPSSELIALRAELLMSFAMSAALLVVFRHVTGL
ncbi:MAG: hypothetical protein WA921_13565 [Ahrensia sp.]